MMKNLKQLFLVFFLGLILAFNGVAYSQDFFQGRDQKPKEKRKERDKQQDKDRGDNRQRGDNKDKKDKPRKPD